MQRKAFVHLTNTKTPKNSYMRKIILSAAILLISLSVSAKEVSGTQDGSVTDLVATPLDSHVLLSWTTTKIGIDIYELERSKNGIDFATISRIEPGSVNTEFMETDFQPLDGMSYYRIKVIDAEGNISYSNATPVKYKAGSPVSPAVGKSASATDHSPVLIVVRNNAGQEYYSKVEVTSDSDPLLATDLEARLAAGTYTIVSSSVQEYYSKQVTVK
jgi:hypothetical protein